MVIVVAAVVVGSVVSGKNGGEETHRGPMGEAHAQRSRGHAHINRCHLLLLARSPRSFLLDACMWDPWEQVGVEWRLVEECLLVGNGGRVGWRLAQNMMRVVRVCGRDRMWWEVVLPKL